jgi:hypothetical protein
VIHPAIYKHLVAAAKARVTVTHAAMCALADLDAARPDDVKILGLILDEIAAGEAAEGRPLLPAVVVGDGIDPTATGLYRYAQRGGQEGVDGAAFVAAERKRVYAHWAEG